jgi:2-phospho-L-lactate guanylyltransferase
MKGEQFGCALAWRRYRLCPTIGNSLFRENPRMTCWAVIPVKPPPERKSRLSAMLDRAARDALVLRMAHHVAETAAHAPGIDRVAFVAPSAEGLPNDVPVLIDEGRGLSEAATAVLRQLGDASRVVIIAGDLPLVTAPELALLATADAGTIAIAPDRHGRGTNALSLPLPRAAGFAFAFGTDSFDKHCAEIRRLGLELSVVRGDGLARDVDEPADLVDAAGLDGAVP